MKRYNKQIYFPKDSSIKLELFLRKLNEKPFRLSAHAHNQIEQRASWRVHDIINWILNKKFLNINEVFEYYELDNAIVKVVFRSSFNELLDIIYVIGDDNIVITTYFNNKHDEHKTLNINLYTTGGANV